MRLICFALLGLILMGCTNADEVSVAGPRGKSVEAELAAFNAVLRACLADQPRRHGAVYVRFTRSSHFQEDPPAEFFVRFSDLGRRVMPRSEYANASRLERVEATRLSMGLTWYGDRRASGTARYTDTMYDVDVRWSWGKWRARVRGVMLIGSFRHITSGCCSSAGTVS